MSLPLYFDHNMPRAVAAELRARGVDVLTAMADRADRMSDELVLARATTLGRVLVTQGNDFGAISSRWLRSGRAFAGIVRVPQQGMSIGAIIEQLEMLATTSEAFHVADQVIYLPLW